MRRIMPILCLAVLLPLAGCFRGQQKQLASCESDAAAAFPHATPGQPLKAVQSCMEKAGYRFIGWDDGVVCDMSALIHGKPGAGPATCFEPTGWLDKKIYRLEVPEKAPPPS